MISCVLTKFPCSSTAPSRSNIGKRQLSRTRIHLSPSSRKLASSKDGADRNCLGLSDMPHCSTGMWNRLRSSFMFSFSSCSTTTAYSPLSRPLTTSSVRPLCAGTASDVNAADTRSGQPTAELKTSTPTTPREFATPSTATVSVQGPGEMLSIPPCIAHGSTSMDSRSP